MKNKVNKTGALGAAIALGLFPRGNRGLRRSLGRGPKQTHDAVQKVLTGSAVSVSLDGTAVGFGSIVIGNFPEGNVLYLGCVAEVSLDNNGDANIVDTFDSDYAIGTTPVDDGTATAGDVDLIPSTTVAQAVAGVTPTVRATHAVAVTGTVIDNTAGSLEINLNVLIDDADITTDGPVLATYDVRISYLMLGDD